MRLYAGARNKTGRLRPETIARVLAKGSPQQVTAIQRYYLPPEAGHAVCGDCGEPFQYTRRRCKRAPRTCGPCGRARYERGLEGRK